MKTLADFREAIRILTDWCVEQPDLARFSIDHRTSSYTSLGGVNASIISVQIWTGEPHNWTASQAVIIYHDEPPDHMQYAALKGVDKLNATIATRRLVTSPGPAGP